VRENQLQKAGPLKTDQDFFIVDAPFPALLTAADVAAGAAAGDGSDGSWEVERLSREIGLITGVLEVGLFCGLDGVQAERLRREGRSTAGKLGGQRPVAVYFGMQDGSVKVRTAPARG
jgi:ribose 5-phosphate isomerase A